MIRKLFALLALVGLAAAPTTGWAATYRARVIVKSTGNGVVYDTKTKTDISAITNWQSEKDSTETESSTQAFTAYIYAKANAGYAFKGWYEDEGCTKLFSENVSDQITINGHKGGLFDYKYEEKTLYAKFEASSHVCTFHYVKDDSACTIMKECTDSECDQGGNRVTYALSIPSATFDRNQHAATFSTVGAGKAECTISYNSDATPVNAGTYEVTMKIDGGTAENSTLTKSFTINPAEINSVTFNPASQNYTGSARSSAMTVKAGNVTLNAEEYTITAGTTSGVVGSPSQDTETTVTVASNSGNFTGSASGKWTIKAPTGSFDADALSTSAAGCTASGNTVSVSDSTKLEYVAENTWCASAIIRFPKDFPTYSTKQDDGDVKYIDEAHALIESAVGSVSKDIRNKQYKIGSSVLGDHNYIDTITWTVDIPLSDITTAKTVLEYEISVGALAWTHYTSGLKPTTYTLSIPLEGIKLNDQYGNQVYPPLTYIANIGAKKFETLAEALGSELATAGQTVEVFGDAAAESGLVVPVGVTLNLGAHGNAESSYVLTGAQLNNDAKVVSTVKLDLAKFSAKGDGVADNFFKVVETEDSGTYTYELALNHEHLWGDFELNGNVLTAKCTNTLNDCTYGDGTVSITLNAEGKAWNSDDSAVTPTLSGTEAFDALLKDGEQHAVTIGAPTVEHPAYSTDKWLTGAYTAKCTVTIDGVDYELQKAFEITKPEGGYTSGFEAQIDGYGVRFGSLSEAANSVPENSVIMLRYDGWNAASFIATAGQNITLDLNGKTLTYSRSKEAASDFTLKNDGAGTVTLVNGTIQQPVGQTYSWGWKDVYYNVVVSGNFVFGQGLFVKREDNTTVTATNGKLSVVDGKYQSAFVGETEISGGVFTVKPTLLAPDHIAREISGDYKYEVVEHHHNVVYSAAENVITATCDADDHEFCGYGSPTVTLTAKNEKVSGQPYSSASIAYSDGFPKKDAVITFWKGDEPVVGDLTVTGDYVAKVTVEGATAVAEFQIFHEHEYMIEKTDDVTLTANCQADGTCDAPTRTLKLVAESRDWQKGTVFAASLEDGFGEAIAYTVSYVYKQGGETIAAPKLTGEYTVEATVTINETPYVLTKAFAITKPASGYTAGYEVKGAEGEESKWLCYDTFADAVAAAEEKGTVVWHEGGDNLRQATFDFKSDKNITVDLNGKNFSYDSDGHVTIKNSGSGRVKLINGTLRTAGSGFSINHNIYLQGKLTLGDGISVEKYSDLSSAGLDIREGADIILAGGTYRGTLDVNDNSKLTITGGKYNLNYRSAMTTYVPDRGDGHVVRSISEDSGNLIYYVVPHNHVFTGSANGGVLTVKCTGTDSDLCNYKNGATITLTAANAPATGEAYAGAAVDNQFAADEELAARCPEAAALSVADVVYYAAADQTTPLLGAPVECGEYVAMLTYGEGTASVEFKIWHAEHSYAFTADDESDTITAKCEAEGPCEEGNKEYVAKMEIADETTYTGNAVTAATTVDTGFPGGIAVEYWQGQTKLDAAPTNVGSYVARMIATTNSATAAAVEKAFTINPKPVITITIAKDVGIADVQTNGVTVVGALDLPADATTVELTLVADGLTIPVYKWVKGNVTNVTSKTATYPIAAGDTLTFFAEEAKVDDPNVSDKDVADAIIAAVDPGESHDAAVANIETVIGGDEPKVEPKELAKWITDKSIRSVDIAESDYLAASVKLDTPKPITDETEVKVETFENVSAEDFELSITIKIDKDATAEVVKAAKEKVVGYIQAVDVLGNEFGPVDANRVEIDLTTGKVTITPAEGKTSEFFKIVIPKDK